MTKQAEREYAGRVEQWHLYRKPYDCPQAMREFGLALEVLRRHAPFAGRVLDLGCGPGWTSLFLCRAGFDVLGVDISQRMVEIARERAAAEQSPARFAVADIEELDLPERDFDAVLLYDALHHCPGYPEVLRRAALHLRPGGVLLLLEPSWLHLLSPHARHHAKEFGVTELGFSRRALRRLLLRSGFSSVRAYHDAGPLYRGLGGFLLANLRLWLSFLSAGPHIKQILLAVR